MIKVVILGGGFAGVSAAKKLLKKTRRSEVQITLIDKNSYHLFTPSLYEVASSEEPQKNICIPLHEILKGVEIIKGEVQKIDKDEKSVRLKDQNLNYDYLIIALGSEPDYRDIFGLEQYSIPFKTLENAAKIKNIIREKFGEVCAGEKVFKVLIGGGGSSGCEFASELTKYRKKECLKHKKQEEVFKIAIFQKSPQLVRELNIEAAKIAYQRLIKHGVEVNFGQRIAKVEENFIETDTGDKYEFDVLVWAGGIRGNSVLKSSGFEINEQGRVSVNQELRIMNYENVFAAGDLAFLDEKISNTVRVAREQGEIAGRNATHKIKGEQLERYEFKNDIFIVPLVGKYAVVQFNNFLIKGFIGWVIQQLLFLRYLLSILPVSKALKRWNRFEEYLMK